MAASHLFIFSIQKILEPKRLRKHCVDSTTPKHFKETREETQIVEITDVRVRKVNKDGKMKAIVSVTFDNEFVVHDIKVIEGDKGLFIAMPSRKTLDGDFRDIAHPISSETRERIQSSILEKYETALFVEEAAADMELE
jgi:stage V sporulation protein G